MQTNTKLAEHRLFLTPLKHLIFIILPVALCLLASCSGLPPYPGDQMLALTDQDFQSATRDQTLKSVHELFKHLQLPENVQKHYAFMSGARFQKTDKYYEASELSETILVAAKSVRVGFAKNTVIISNGEVDISHASGVVIISRGSIRISHGQSLDGIPGLFVTAGSANIGYATGASVYAVAGAEFSQTGAISAYNTDIRKNLYGVATKYRRAPIFHDEPVRNLDSPSMIVSSGESMRYSGTRCLASPSTQALADRLPISARRALNCPRIDTIVVQCQTDEKSGRSVTTERWSFNGCAKKVHFDVVRQSGGTSISVPITDGMPTPSLFIAPPVVTSPGGVEK